MFFFIKNQVFRLFIVKIIDIMPCGCKNRSKNKQPAAVKQVVKNVAARKPETTTPTTVTRKVTTTRRRVVVRRPI